jgi:hypothetical protein
MAVTAFHDFTLALRDREWDGAAAEKRVRAWADAQDKPTPRYRDAHIGRPYAELVSLAVGKDSPGLSGQRILRCS